jgi:alkylated DNA repair dioxygenase AlkB
MPDVADQMIVNEYQPGSGIPAHVDATFFGDTVVSLSLGSTCVIVFDDDRSAHHEELLLEPRSALVMTLDARHTWKHGIRARHSDTWQGREWPRGRRLSLTFRTMRVRSGYA